MISSLTVAVLAQAIAIAFAGGALLLLVLTLLPATRAVARQLWPVLASEAAILAVGVLPWLLPKPFLFTFLLVASARIGYESGTVHGISANRDFQVSHAATLVVVSAISWFAPTVPFLWVLAILTTTVLATVALTTEKSVARSLARFTVFPLVPMAAFSHAASEQGLAPLLVLAFFLVEMFDSFSLLGGKLYGRTPLVPRLSPRKTWEGLGTGMAAVLISVLTLTLFLELPLAPTCLSGFVVTIAAIAGDLLGSVTKRRAGVKDYPSVMAVQGGLLDIADAWLVAGPCLAALALLLNRV